MPVLVHIGYHKTGTNWLQDVWWSRDATGYRWLGKSSRESPVRRLVLERPFEFDARAVRAAFDPLLRDAEEAGVLPVVSLERLSGHPFSGGHDARQIADRLRAVLPEARVLVVVREQRAMIVSTYKQYVTAGGAGRLRDFLEPPRTKSTRVPWFDFRHFEYHLLIRYYRSLFGADGVLALPFEHFARDGRDFVERVAAFAGRPVPGAELDRLPYGQRENTARSALTIEAMRLANRLAPPSELNPAPLLGSKRAYRLQRRLEKTDGVARVAPAALVARAEASLRREVERAVGDRYAESNRATAELTGFDLAALGWIV